MWKRRKQSKSTIDKHWNYQHEPSSLKENIFIVFITKKQQQHLKFQQFQRKHNSILLKKESVIIGFLQLFQNFPIASKYMQSLTFDYKKGFLCKLILTSSLKFRQFPPLYQFFVFHFQWTKILKFFILHPIISFKSN